MSDIDRFESFKKEKCLSDDIMLSQSLHVGDLLMGYFVEVDPLHSTRYGDESISLSPASDNLLLITKKHTGLDVDFKSFISYACFENLLDQRHYNMFLVVQTSYGSFTLLIDNKLRIVNRFSSTLIISGYIVKRIHHV